MDLQQYQYIFWLLFSLIKRCAMTYLSQTYREMSDPIGRRVCSVDQPDTTLLMAASTMAQRCSVECTTRGPQCRFYQFRADTAHCELFRDMPVNFTVIDQCIAYNCFTGKYFNA